MLKDIKRCRNTFCGNLIYSYQKSFSGYCDSQCVQEVRHTKTVKNNYTFLAKVQEEYNSVYGIQQSYPHKYLPIYLEIE